ncbi:response regulator [Pontibacillus litoralis]|uniref:Response regulatory domain-containing protein n=1 Tax=Pontibacillus litoralis JSM 072002 TaxID=1385512 RepID=A0A0A5G2Q8_9BACI|nr:response regulator [Pontibacillus litoralis]KGX86329.1 hypothetical protein N784_05105 [Pontibacillus litoralis JSM 072002]
MILVIDDNKDVRFTIRETCKVGGWNVEEYSNGKEGTDAFYPGKHQLVMVDDHMPEWDGLRTVKELRKKDSNVPIIAIAEDSQMETAIKFNEAGATDFADKSFKAPDLISRIRLNIKMAKLQDNQLSAFVEKGINEDTLRQITTHLRKQTEPKTITELQQELPVSYQTVHRYLHYLVEMGEVNIQSEYGKKGRPRHLYQFV